MNRDKGLINTLKEFSERRELFRNLVARNLKIRYKNSYLGFFWSLLDPLFMMLIYLIFIKILRFKIDFSQLLIGVLAWHFTAMTMSDSVNAIIGHSSLVKRVYFPRVMIPFSIIAANFINFLLSLVVFVVILLLFNYDFSIMGLLVSFPWVVLLHLIFCLGIASILATLGVFFHDVEHITRVVQMAWFFVSPIIYPLSVVPPDYRTLYMYNPMATIITLYRKVLLQGQGIFANMDIFIYTLVIALLVFCCGLALLLHFERYFSDEL